MKYLIQVRALHEDGETGLTMWECEKGIPSLIYSPDEIDITRDPDGSWVISPKRHHKSNLKLLLAIIVPIVIICLVLWG